jgi:hypothetical protein
VHPVAGRLTDTDEVATGWSRPGQRDAHRPASNGPRRGALIGAIAIAAGLVLVIALLGLARVRDDHSSADRRELNRGGDRSANNALHTIVLSRMRWDPRTRDYVDRRAREGLSKREIQRCLKRYVLREVYTILNGT